MPLTNNVSSLICLFQSIYKLKRWRCSMKGFTAFVLVLLFSFTLHSESQKGAIDKIDLIDSNTNLNSPVDDLPASKLQKLQEKGLLSKKIEQPVPADADILSIKEKFVLADVVVIGTVLKRDYLYKEGEIFRTSYNIVVESYLKGTGKNDITVLDFSGPQLRDHSVWAGLQKNVELNANDRVLVFLKKIPAEKIKKEYPRLEKIALGRYIFQNSYTGIYILNGDEFDIEYLETTTMQCEFRSIEDLKVGINELVAEINN